MTSLSSQTAFGDAREKFVRLQQVSTLLNLDRASTDSLLLPSEILRIFLVSQEENVDEFYNSSGILWKLTETEAQGIFALKM
jgi:hypothetical protein